MRKILNFLVNSENGQKVFNIFRNIVLTSLAIGLALWAPMLWLGNDYDGTWMDKVAPYFLYVYFGYAALIAFLFVPYMSHVAASKDYKGNSKIILRRLALFLSIVPGSLIYSPIAKALMIPDGFYNAIGVFLFGLLYLAVVKAVFKKPFTIAQNFIPLN
jgi:hypothetical protein